MISLVVFSANAWFFIEPEEKLTADTSVTVAGDEPYQYLREDGIAIVEPIMLDGMLLNLTLSRNTRGNKVSNTSTARNRVIKTTTTSRVKKV